MGFGDHQLSFGFVCLFIFVRIPGKKYLSLYATCWFILDLAVGMVACARVSDVDIMVQFVCSWVGFLYIIGGGSKALFWVGIIGAGLEGMDE